MIEWHLNQEETPGDEPAWLSPRELLRLERFKVDKRRADWKLGRFTSKQLLQRTARERFGADYLLNEFEILREPSGAPFVRISPEARSLGGLTPGEPLAVSLSLSHSNAAGFAAVLWRERERVEASGMDWQVGADLEWIEPRSRRFVEDFFVEHEVEAVFSAPENRQPFLANFFWSAKEAVLKALKLGLTADTRDVRITMTRSDPVPEEFRPEGDGWEAFSVDLAPRLKRSPSSIHGFWKEQDNYVLTLSVLSEPSSAPLMYAI